MTNVQPVFKSTAMPAATMPNYPDKSYSPMTAGVILQQQQNASQLKLINASGGRRLRGGQSNALILVPPVPAGAVDPAATKGNYTAITNLAEVGASQSVYDSAQTKEAVAANQKAGSKKGGKWKKGGSWPVWGCLSGGRNYKRKSRKGRKSRKSRNTKRRHR